jgi:hypothetical protein
MPSLFSDDGAGHPWIAARRAAGPTLTAAPVPDDELPDHKPRLVLFTAACAVAAIAGAAIEVLR